MGILYKIALIQQLIILLQRLLITCLYIYIYIYLYFRTFIKYNIMVIYRVDYEQKKKRIIQK